MSTVQVPAYKFSTKQAALNALNAVNQHFGFTFDISGYDETYIEKQGRYYYVPKDMYTAEVIGQSKQETYYEVEVQEFEHDNGEGNSGMVGESADQ